MQPMPHNTKGTTVSIPTTSAVLGSGSMGPGIAALLARYGSDVRLYDVSEEALARAEGTCAGVVALCWASSSLDVVVIPRTARSSR